MLTKNYPSKLLLNLDTAIMRICPKNIGCDEYPIYKTYYRMDTDIVFAVVYPTKEHIEIGIYLKKGDIIDGLISAKHMKYPNISKAIVIKKNKDINMKLKCLLKTAYNNSQVMIK